MMLKSLFPISLMIIALLLAVSCSNDDECPNCPTDVDTVTLTETVNDTLNIDFRKLIVSGEAHINSGYITLWFEIYDADGRMPQLDSLTVAGTQIDLNAYYDDGAICLETEDEMDGEGYSSGDELEIIAYTPDCNGSCLVTLFDYYGDSPTFVDWRDDYPWDTVDVSTEIVVDWNPVIDADWYAYRLYHYYDSSGSRYSRTEGWTSDTTLTIPAESNGSNGYWNIYIYASSGPSPDDAGGNFTGCEAVSGRIISSSRGDLTIYVGTGDDSPPTLAKPYVAEDDRAALRDLLKNLQSK